MGRKFTDNALTTLAQGLLIGGTTLAVQAGNGDNFPAVTGRGAAGSAPDYFVITLEDASGNREKIKVEHRQAGNDSFGSVGYPLIRGHDGTAPRAWNAGDSVDLRWDKSEATEVDDKTSAGSLGRAFGLKGSTTAGLNFGYYGGGLMVDGVFTPIADGTIALTANQTNYIERTVAGAVNANIVGFSADKIPLYQITTDASGITALIDKRASNLPIFGYVAKDVSGGAGITVLTADEVRAPIIEFFGVLTGARAVELPAQKRSWTIFNNTTGAFNLTVRVTGQGGLVIPQTKRASVFCDGVDIRPALTDFAQAQKHTVWVPAPAMTARITTGPLGPNQTESTQKINLRTLDFDQATQQHAQFPVSMPKGWDAGTLTAKFVWTAAGGAGGQGVVWGIHAVSYGDGDQIDTSLGVAQEVTDALLAANQVHHSADTAAITIGNGPAARELVVFEVYRKAADAADTLASPALLIGVELTVTFKASDDS